MTLQNHLSRNITAIFKQQRKTLFAFSEELGISRSTLQEIMKGNCNPRLDTIEQIAKGLNIDPLELLASSYSSKKLQILSPLFHLSDAAATLPDSRKQDLTVHFHAIIDILMRPDEDRG